MDTRNFQSADEDLEEACFEKANHLITECHLNHPRVTSLSDLNFRLFVLLFDAICKPKETYYKDLKYHMESKVDEAHNVQVIIDTLSLDLLGISLSYITGEDIVAGNVSSIFNLLEVLEGYFMYLALPENVPSVGVNGVQKSTADNVPHGDVAISDWVCPACGHRKPFEELIVQQANVQDEDFSCLCSNCHRRFPIIGSHLHTDYTFQSHSRKAINGSSRRLLSNELQEGPLASSSKQFQSSSNSFASIPRPTPMRNGKLKPEFARVGLRDDLEEQTEVKTVMDFLTSSSSGDGRTSTKSSVQEPSISIATSPPLSTVIFKGHHMKVPQPSSSSYIPIQKEQPDREATVPKRMLSRSMDDICSTQSTKQDQMVQTDSFFKKKSKRLRPPAGSAERIQEDQRPHTPSDDHKDLVDRHAQNMEYKIRLYLEKGIEHRRRASEINKIYQQAIKPPKRKPSTPLCRKSFLLPYYLRRRTTSITTPKRLQLKPNLQLSELASSGRSDQPPTVLEEDFLRELREEFPGVHLSPATVRKMSEKYQKHLATIHKNVKASLLKKSQIQIQTEEATRRQEILSDILKKEVHHMQHLNDFKEHRDLAQQVKTRARDARLDSVRMKQYHEEFCNEMQKKMGKRNYREEQLIKNVFDEGLDLQKDQVRLLRQQLREKENRDAKHHKIYLDSLENFYQTQFSLLAESLALEKRDMQERTKAQQRVLRMMKRNNRKQLENEVRSMQDQLVRNSEEIHFRELDVERYREKLRDRFSAHPLANNL